MSEEYDEELTEAFAVPIGKGVTPEIYAVLWAEAERRGIVPKAAS